MSHKYIVSALHGKVLNVEHGHAKNGARIVLWDKEHNAKNEQWTLVDAGNGYFHIASAVDSNFVIDVENGQGKEGERLILYQRKHPPAKNQLFKWHGESLQSALGSDLVLDIEGGNKESGTQIVLWKHKHGDSDNQNWHLH